MRHTFQHTSVNTLRVDIFNKYVRKRILYDSRAPNFVYAVFHFVWGDWSTIEFIYIVYRNHNIVSELC